MSDALRRRLDGTRAAIESIGGRLADVEAIGRAILAVFERGGTLYTAGNGGSAAEALHLSEELIGRYRGDRRPYPAICLAADPTALTCIANDFGFDEAFARPCRALLTERDALLVLSTSGNSRNVVAALEVAREVGAVTLGLLGRTGGACRALCDHALLVDADDSAHIQEGHLVAVHMICEMVETATGV